MHLIDFNLSRYYEEALAHRVDKMVFVAFGVADGVIKPEDAEGRLQTFLANPADGSSAATHAGQLERLVPLYANSITATANVMAFLEAAKRFANTGEGRPKLNDFIGESSPALVPPAP